MSREEFIVEDYKLALQYLQAQFERLWQRFSFFLTLQMGLFGFLGWLAYNKGSLKAAPFVAALGAFVSAVWYVVAAQDRFLVETYRKRTAAAAERIAALSELEAKDYASTFVGAQPKSDFHSPLSWYSGHLSMTRLPVWISAALALVWLGLLCKGASWLAVPQ